MQPLQFKDVRTVRILSQNVQLSSEWYSRLFGMPPKESENNFVRFELDGFGFEIVLADDKNPFSQGGTVAYFAVEDLKTAIEACLTLGGKLYRGPLNIPEARKTIAQVQDLFGNVIGLEAVL
jgi:predicted enzyme related to lactoylglutathione lyase